MATPHNLPKKRGAVKGTLISFFEGHFFQGLPHWDPALRCVTIGDMDLVPTLEEYNRFLSLSTPMSTVCIPLVRTWYCKKLADLMGFKWPIVEVLTWHGSEVEASMSFEFLHDRFHLPE